jgi:hypothetical protein
MTQFHLDSPQVSSREPRADDALEGFWLSFNVHGRIVYCTQPLALVCGRDTAQIHGASISTLLPELPVNGVTARQRVAAMMDLGNGCHRLQLTLADGRALPVDASISSTLTNTGPIFIVDLRCAPD